MTQMQTMDSSNQQTAENPLYKMAHMVESSKLSGWGTKSEAANSSPHSGSSLSPPTHDLPMITPSFPVDHNQYYHGTNSAGNGTAFTPYNQQNKVPLTSMAYQTEYQAAMAAYPHAHRGYWGMTSSGFTSCPSSYPTSYPAVPQPTMATAHSVPGQSALASATSMPSDNQHQEKTARSRSRVVPLSHGKSCPCVNCNSTDKSKRVKGVKKEHPCIVPGCNKKYYKTSHLKAHIRGHNNEKPYGCDYEGCNKHFTRTDELTRHKRTHTGDKRFKCNTCYKGFTRSDHLAKHVKTHENKMGRKKRMSKASRRAQEANNNSNSNVNSAAFQGNPETSMVPSSSSPEIEHKENINSNVGAMNYYNNAHLNPNYYQYYNAHAYGNGYGIAHNHHSLLSSM